MRFQKGIKTSEIKTQRQSLVNQTRGTFWRKQDCVNQAVVKENRSLNNALKVQTEFKEFSSLSGIPEQYPVTMEIIE
jgi:hypothetical protein